MLLGKIKKRQDSVQVLDAPKLFFWLIVIKYVIYHQCYLRFLSNPYDWFGLSGFDLPLKQNLT